MSYDSDDIPTHSHSTGFDFDAALDDFDRTFGGLDYEDMTADDWQAADDFREQFQAPREY